jgi:putative tricarboxylic transport membrane protein
MPRLRDFALVLSLALAVRASAQPSVPALTIVAPAAPGGGWDQLARTMQRVLEIDSLVPRVQVENVSGAAGTVGLARFVSAQRANPDALLVTGLVMIGGVAQNASPVSLANTTPIARLVGEYEVLVVPASSPFRSLQQLLNELARNPGAISWGGGSAGGTDQILVDLIARAKGIDPKRTNYIAFSGGGEVTTALLGAQVTVGVSGYGEVAGLIAEGRARALAISSPRRVAGVDIPTLRESGVAVDLANWRGIVAPPGITPARRLELIRTMERMVASRRWRDEIVRRGWQDLWLQGDAFTRFIDAETRRVESLVAIRRGGSTVGRSASIVRLPLAIATLLAVSLAVVILQAKRRSRDGAIVVGETDSPLRPRHHRAVALVALGMALDVALIDWLGFVVAGAVLFSITAWAFGERRSARSALLGLAFTTVVFLVFRMALGVPLPAGRVWELLS